MPVSVNQLGSPWPVTAERASTGKIQIGGVSLPHLAERYGTPLYVLDVATIEDAAKRFRSGFETAFPKVRVVYAAKAFLATGIVPILAEAGIGMDVVSGGELFIAVRGGMPASEISFHGNNKSQSELAEAIAAGVAKIVIDNNLEIDHLADLVANRAHPQDVMLRVNPGVDVHTHRKISTGIADSKFGFPIVDGQAMRAARRVAATPGLNLVGLHAHVGSQLFDMEAHEGAIAELLDLASGLRDELGVEIEHLSPGGGFGIAYIEGDNPPAPEVWAQTLASSILGGCETRGIAVPTITIEPGRALIGPAGVAVYRLGARKELAGIRTYVSVDGGMADNIRPSLYDATYTAQLANRGFGGGTETVTIAGKYCESGDVLLSSVELPAIEPGDLLAVPAAGAYTLAMASNYNASLRPPVVLVANGTARIIRRRETYDDLIRTDLA